MGTTAEITLVFRREKHARWATHIVEGILKAALVSEYALGESLGIDEFSSLMATYMFNEEKLNDYDAIEEYPHCALAWMERRGSRVVVRRCADIQSSFALNEPALMEEPFPQICIAYAMRFPQVPFAAYCRWEQTVSGAVQLTRASWDTQRLRFRQFRGDLPCDEKAGDTWEILDVRFYDGEIKICDEAVSPLERHYRELLDELQEARIAGDVAGALYFADAAEALRGCEHRPEAAIQRGLACEHLRRYGVRRVMELRSRVLPQMLREELEKADPVLESPLGGGRFVLKAQERGFAISDTHDDSIVEEVSGWSLEPIRVVHDFLVSAGDFYYLIDWHYTVEPPLETMW